MQQPFPTTPSEPENKCLGCLFMKLEGIPAQLENESIFMLKPESVATTSINLYLTLEFNEQRELLFGGRIKFGLKGGELRLKLENAEFLLESREMAGMVKLAVHNDIQQESSRNHSTIAVSLAESKPGVKANSDTKKTDRKTDSSEVATCQVQFIDCQVTTKGSQENPTWVFEVKTGQPVLKGLLKNAKLGTLDMTAKPCRIEATFEVLPQDVYITEAEGLSPKHISKKRRAVIERAIARRFLERKLKPYLSRQVLQYD